MGRRSNTMAMVVLTMASIVGFVAAAAGFGDDYKILPVCASEVTRNCLGTGAGTHACCSAIVTLVKEDPHCACDIFGEKENMTTAGIKIMMDKCGVYGAGAGDPCSASAHTAPTENTMRSCGGVYGAEDQCSDSVHAAPGGASVLEVNLIRTLGLATSAFFLFNVWWSAR